MCGPVIVILTGLPRQRRHRLELVDQAEIDIVVDAAVAGRGRMEDVRDRAGVIGFGRVLPWKAGIFCQK